MTIWERVKGANWRMLAATFCAAATLHICATLATPRMATASAYERLEQLLPVNTMQILPAFNADNQPLPYLAPDGRYAMCRFNSKKATIELSATLPEPGWTLSLHSPEGDNFYTAVAQPGRETEVSLMLIPTDERFTGLTPESTGRQSTVSVSLTLVASEGIAVLRAPDLGVAARARSDAQLARAHCGPKKL